MGQVSLCDPYVWEDPRYLFRSTWLNRHARRHRSVCASELINEIIFIYVFALVIGAFASFITKVSGALMISVFAATIYLIPSFMKLREVEAFRIQFIGSEEITRDSEDPDPLYKAGLGTKEGFVVSQPEPDLWGCRQ